MPRRSAFEMSVGRQRLVVNAGPGQVFGGDWTLLARQTAAQSAVEVDGRSSARIEAGGLAARTFGARLAEGPALVSVRQAQDATGQWLLADPRRLRGEPRACCRSGGSTSTRAARSCAARIS